MLAVRRVITAILLASALGGRAVAYDIQYSVTDLGVLSGAPSNGGVYPKGINDLGQVVGNGDTTVSTSNGTVLAEHAFLYTGSGSLVDLGAFPGADSFSVATGINNSGLVCGYSDSSGTGNPTRAAVWTQSGGMKDLGALPGGLGGIAYAINNNGQVAGIADTVVGGAKVADGFVYSGNGPMVDLGPYQALCINDAGLIAAVLGPSGSLRTFISTGGTSAWTNIGSLGGLDTQPEGMNNRGEVVGFSTTSVTSQYQAFMYSGGTMTGLGDPFGGDASEAFAVNGCGTIVGWADLPGDEVSHAFIEGAGGPMQDLNDLVAPMLGWTLVEALAVNDQGQLAVLAQSPQGARALLLTPLPEPPSLFLGIGSILAITISRTGARFLRRAGSIWRSLSHPGCQATTADGPCLSGGYRYARDYSVFLVIARGASRRSAPAQQHNSFAAHHSGATDVHAKASS